MQAVIVKMVKMMMNCHVW